jgi:predicted aminopeptidase
MKLGCSATAFMRLAKTVACMGILACLVGCSPGYVMRAAYEQSKILLARRPIDAVMSDPSTNQEDRTKLEFVRSAREFASEIGLKPGDSFTTYSDIGKETLAWVVVASRRDAFALHTWWFPIVGTVPYKGFFDQEDAKEQAKRLEEQGYESSVRGTEAFSTLGWFNDPLLSTTLRNPTYRIVNTVIHESVHTTVWIKDNVPFNETLASFVGSQAGVEFFSKQLTSVKPGEPQRAQLEALLKASEHDQRFQSEFARVITDLYEQLSTLYSDKQLSSAQKIEQRSTVFDRIMQPFRATYPQMTALKKINNAEILQFTIYMTKLELFEKLFSNAGGSWSEFFKHIDSIKDAVDRDSGKDPWTELQTIVYSSKPQQP